MSITLEVLAPCFQGLIPATLFTCSREGVPNVALLSHVEYVDARHVALSFQFFNKSRRNIAENPYALVRVIDPDARQGWELALRFARSETSGPIFERMDLRIEAIASYSGLKGIFKLLAADIYEVESIARVPEEVGVPRATPLPAPEPGARRTDRRNAVPDAVFTMKAMQDLSYRIHHADSLEHLLDSILAGLEEAFGFTHSMILLPGEDDRTLVTIASRGYTDSGVGAEVHIGEGIIGVAAEARKPIRISGLLREMLYASAVQKRAREAGLCPYDARIPLPGLPSPESQLGVPLLVRGELVGVLCIESEVPYRFHEEDKTSVELLGSYLAIAVQNMLLRERADAAAGSAAQDAAGAHREHSGSGEEGRATAEGAAVASPVVSLDRTAHGPAADAFEHGTGALAGSSSGVSGAPTRHEVTYYRTDECILVDGEYLIRSLPARILWKLLSLRDSCGRVEFTNRELRLDRTLGLPEYKDNLESRLLLLRRRLEQKCPDIRIAPSARGRFLLEVRSALLLSEQP